MIQCMQAFMQVYVGHTISALGYIDTQKFRSLIFKSEGAAEIRKSKLLHEIYRKSPV